MPLSLYLLGMLFSIALCVHVVRSGQNMMWLYIILFLSPLGGIVYLIAVIVPQWTGGPAARKAREAARETLDPTRDYRQAKQAVEDTPTAHNRMRLAAAAGELGKWDEAEAVYRSAAQGVHAEDSALAYGLARSLVELGRYAEARPLLEKLEKDSPRTPQTALQLARTYEGLGLIAEAEAPYHCAAARLPGLEGLARPAGVLARTGRQAEAEDALNDIDKRLARTNARFQKEGRQWRDLAAEAVRRAR
ncbi:MAG: tetratricopeptide repeat protein [Caulobacteraceae bacterium]